MSGQRQPQAGDTVVWKGRVGNSAGLFEWQDDKGLHVRVPRGMESTRYVIKPHKVVSISPGRSAFDAFNGGRAARDWGVSQ